MMVAYGYYNAAQTNTELVAAEAGKIIRVQRILLTAWGDVKVTLISDPGGAGSTNLLPPLHLASGSVLTLPLGPRSALVTGRGKSLGVTTAFKVMAAEHSVVVWYDVVA